MSKKILLKKRENITSLKHQGYKINYREELNDAQYSAVMHNDGAALVIAGAGTGKTRTLIYRVARLIEDGNDPSSILLLTFTRKSALEMMRRATELLDTRAEKVQGGTFHSFAMNLLRKYSTEIGYGQNFNVLDQKDAEDVINFIRTSYLEKFKSKRKRFPSKSIISDIISMSINKSLSLIDTLTENFPNFIEYDQEITEMYLDYITYKKNSNIMDYDDLLVNLRKLLKTNAKVKELINNTYKFVMVDEYQDTNKLQHEIVLLLSNKTENVMAVGDDAQSIYSFRGSDFQNIFFFPESFSNCIIYKIEENYRSNNQILNLSNFVINQATYKYDKNLYSSVDSDNLPKIIATNDERQQSEFIIQQILEYSEQGIKLNDIAILFRSAFHSFDLEIELNKSNIPYRKFGGFKFMETSHIKDILAFIKILYNPKDLISWQRVLILLEGVGTKTISKVSNLLSNESLSLSNYNDILDTEIKNLNIKNLFKELSNIDLEKIKVPSLVIKISNFYKPLLEKKYDDKEKRWKDIETFINIAENYKNVNSFLTDMALDPPSESVDEINSIGNENEFLNLSTIHSAKGLEWKIVFIIWALEGRFPSLRSADSTDKIEEERRLFYVAATRAKDELYISYPQNIFDNESGFVLSKVSRFIDNISEELADFFVLVEEE